MAISRMILITTSMYIGVEAEVVSTAISFRIREMFSWSSERYRGKTLGRGSPGFRPGKLPYKRVIAHMLDGHTSTVTGIPEEQR